MLMPSLRLLAVLLVVVGGSLPGAAQKPASSPKGAQASVDSADAAVLDAAQRGDLTALTAALDAGGTAVAADANDGSALLRAAYGGHLGIVRALVEAGAPVDEPRGFLWLDEATGFYLSGPLHAAAMGGHEAAAQYLITEGGADVDALSWDPHQAALRGWTPLQWAVVAGQIGLVGVLLDAGASPDAAAPNTAPPLAMAIQSGQVFVMAALNSAGADADAAQAYLPVALEPDATQSAALTANHPRNEAGSHYATFTLDVDAPVPFTVAVSAQDFDPLLLAVAPSQAVYTNDDWLGQRDTARVMVDQSEVGTWQFTVWSYASGETGTFDVGHRTLAPDVARALQARAVAAARADSLVLAAQAQDGLGRPEVALALDTEAVAAREAALGASHPLLATHLNNLALRHAELGQHDQADALYRRALAMSEAELGPEHPDVAVTLGNHAILLQERGRYREAASHMQRALAIQEANTPAEPGPDAAFDLALALNNTAVALVAVGRLDEAEPLHLRALALRESLAEGAPDDTGAQQRLASTLSNLAALRGAQARFEEAQAYAEQAVAVLEAAFGPEAPELGTSLNTLASIYADLADYGRAEATHQRALALHRTAFGDDHPDVAMSLGNLAGVLDATGQTAEAAPLYAQALAIAERTLGPDHPNTLIALNNLAAFQRGRANFADAETRYRDALARFERAYDRPHPNVATAQGNLAALLQATGRYAEAESLFVAAQATYEAALGPDHPDVAVGLNNLAGLYEQTGRFAEAEERYTRALALREATFGTSHPAVAQGQGNLGTLYAAAGRYAEAEPLLLAALAAFEASRGEAYPDVAVALGNLGAFYQAQGRYAEAEIRLERARAVYEATLGPDHPDTATGAGNLAALYAEAGRLAEAVPLVEEALAIRTAAFGAEHPDVALSLSNLATLDARRGDLASAEERERQALALREATLGDDHPNVATSLNNLAVYVEDAAEAEALLRRSLAIATATFGSEHPDVALAQHNLADELREQGRSDEARSLAEAALDVRRRVLGSTHPVVALTLTTLIDLDMAEGRLADADARFREALAVEQAVIDDLLPHATEREQQAFLRTRLPIGLVTGAALIADGETQEARTATAFAHLLQRKSLRLDVQTARLRTIRAAQGADTTAVQLLGKLQAVGQRLAQETFAGPGAEGPEAYRARLDTLRARRVVLENQFARASADVLARPGLADADAVAAAVPEGEHLVEYVRLRPYEFGAASEDPRWQDARYVAFVTGRAAPVRLVDLGVATEIDSLVAQFRMQVVAPQRMGLARQRRARRAFDATANALYARLLAPLGLDAAAALRIAPDGALHTLPFEALRDGDGAFVTDTRRVSYLTSSRTLARPHAASMPNDSLVVFAAVDYDAPATGIRTGADDAANPSGLADAGGQSPAQRGGGFAALLGTEAEATMLATLGLPVRSFLGAEATEERLLALDTPGRLHIATHGFFLNDAAALETITGARSGTLSGSLGSGGAGEGSPVDEEQFADPLLRSGLALAGANRIGTDRVADDPDATTDGIATAYELASLDLRGTDLVVLSACETGLGEIEAGEGVLGLRRAFEVAGAETVVMSLWKVPDAATAALMAAFYGALNDGRTKAEALREAAAVVRAEERWAHPYWWAAFVLAGATE